MQVHSLLLLFSLLSLLNIGIASESHLDSLEQKGKQFPKELLLDINNNQVLGLSSAEYLYLEAFAYENLGEIQKTDSLLRLIDLDSIQEESPSLYIKCSVLAARHQKLLGEFEKSYLVFQELFSFISAREDTSQLITTHIAMAELYRASEESDLGLLELQKAERLIQQHKGHNLEPQLAYLYNRKAALIQNRDSTEYFSLKSLAIARRINNQDLIATACNELGAFYFNQTPINPESKIYLEEAIRIWDQLNYDIYATSARVNLARYYNRIHEDEKSLQVLLPIKELVDQSYWIDTKASYYVMLGRTYARLERYKEAYLSKRVANKYLLYQEKTLQQRIAIYAYKLDVQEKEKKIELAELKLNNEKSEKKVLYLILTSILLFVLAIIFFYLKLTHRKNEISSQRDLLKDQTETISQSNNQLNQLLSQKETLLKEVNHRVKNNLTVLSSLLNLQANSEENKQIKEALQDSQLRIQSISLIHESLYQNNNDQLDFKIYLENLFSSIRSLYWGKKTTVNLNTSLKDYQPSFKESIPIGMILNELMTNSFKYAFHDVKDPTIYISATSNSISYCDNGPGFSNHTNASTLGLKLISIFAIQLEAKLSYQEQNGMKQTLIEWE